MGGEASALIETAGGSCGSGEGDVKAKLGWLGLSTKEGNCLIVSK